MATDTLVVMPTVRDYQVMSRYFANADRFRFPRARMFVLLVTEDHCDKAAMKKFLRDEGVEGDVHGATERSAYLKSVGLAKAESLIPRRSHAETSYGLLHQWEKGFETGIFIDDDTVPTADDYFGGHMRNLAATGSMPRVRGKTGWVNVLHQTLDRHKLHPRGFPYGHMFKGHTTKKGPVRRVVASQGLWTNVADLDAARILVGGDLQGQGRPFTKESDFPESFVVETGSQTTVCSMNLAFKREIIPAFYQFPMDDNEWKVGRFDDIWSGFCLKHIADAKGVDIVHGRPLCRHNKAPRSTFKDLVAEANGLELNEHFTEHLAPVEKSMGWDAAYRHMAKGLQTMAPPNYVNAKFLTHCGNTMEAWVDALDHLA